MKWRFLILVLLAAIIPTLLSAVEPLPYRNPALPVEQRVTDLLSRMTLEEKVAQLNLWPNLAELLKQTNVSEDIALTLAQASNGIGAMEYEAKLPPEDFARFVTSVQRFLVEQTRLGIPVIFDAEACHGFVGTNATVFPTPMALASSWDPALVERVYQTIAAEMRAYGMTHAATPVLDLAHDPRFGRFDEFYSEDPYLVGEMGIAAIFGLQGRQDKMNDHHLLACAKHFAGHGQPEGGGNMAPANFSERILREQHFYPFEQAVKRARVRTIMASYNEMDGVPNHLNHWLLTDVLRGEWGFDGAVISDYDGVSRTIDRQFACASTSEAGLRALSAGVDFELPSCRTNDCFQSIPALIRAGQLDAAVVDRAVSRILRNKFLLGLFEHPYPPGATVAKQVMNGPAHQALAHEAAEKGIILLKNENHTLPFQRDAVRHLAVIGPNADEVHYGSYSATTPGVSIVEGLRAYGKDQFEVHYAEGFKIYENDKTISPEEMTIEAENRRIAKAVEVAQKSDAVLLVMGENENTCHESWFPDHFGDRNDLTLLGRQNDLARAIVATGKPVAVLLVNGRALAINELATNAPAILEGWYLGQRQGAAVARVLFGDVNPSGKLTVTIPRSVGDLPVYYNHKPLVHEHPFVSGPYSPLYAFGHGLSYTTFQYDDLVVSPAAITNGQSVAVSVKVTNTGDRAGDEIVQLYLRDMVSSVTRPVKELKDFRRITLAPGEARTVQFAVTPDKLQFYDVNMKRVVEPGEFKVMVGTSSEKYLSTSFHVLP